MIEIGNTTNLESLRKDAICGRIADQAYNLLRDLDKNRRIENKTYKDFFDISIIRPFFIYGQNQKKHMLFPRLTKLIKEKKEIVLKGKNGVTINPIHAQDVANAVLSLISKKSIYAVNLGGTENFSLRDAIIMISSFLGVKPLIKIENTESNDYILANIDLMKKELYIPKIQFNKGILDVIKSKA